MTIVYTNTLALLRDAPTLHHYCKHMGGGHNSN